MIRPVPGLRIEQQPVDVLSRMLVYGEARGEDPIGQIAVLHVARNRARARGTTLYHEILAPQQFSCFNADDPNRKKMLEAWIEDPQAWRVVDTTCFLVESGLTLDPTKGATHYYVVDMPNPPAWGRGNPYWNETATIGRHVFGVCP